MKHVGRITHAPRRAMTFTALISSIAIGSLSGRASADNAPAHTGSAAPAAQTAPAAQSPPGGGVDSLIAHLHEKFMITPAQEGSWRKLADVMRENAQTMSVLAKKRFDGAKTMTALDDLKSYAEISEAHAEGTKKMIPAFQAVYESMSDTQKKEADTEFKEHYAEHKHQHH